MHHTPPKHFNASEASISCFPKIRIFSIQAYIPMRICSTVRIVMCFRLPFIVSSRKAVMNHDNRTQPYAWWTIIRTELMACGRSSRRYSLMDCAICCRKFTELKTKISTRSDCQEMKVVGWWFDKNKLSTCRCPSTMTVTTMPANVLFAWATHETHWFCRADTCACATRVPIRWDIKQTIAPFAEHLSGRCSRYAQCRRMPSDRIWVRRKVHKKLV